jgi:hypothetical protein
MDTAIRGHHDVVDAIRTLLRQALSEGVRELWWSDVDFAEWPLNEPALIEALTQWARPHHRLHLFAQHYDEVARRHPRFVRWRRDFDHVVQAWRATEPDAAAHPGLCIAGDRLLELLDRDHWRAKRSDEPGDARRGREQLDAILQRSTPGFPGTTLGL